MGTPDFNLIHPEAGGTFTIRQVMNFTNQYTNTRMTNRATEKYRFTHVDVFEKTRNRMVDGKWVPKKVYEIVTYMKPKLVRIKVNGITRLLNRRYSQSYQILLEMDELSVDTKHWQARLGTGNYWYKAPKDQVLTIKNTDRQFMDKEEIQELYARKKARGFVAMNEAEWNAYVNGINADFMFRCAYVYQRFGHLCGHMAGLAETTPPKTTNPLGIMFFPKHLINFIELLLTLGVFRDDDRRESKNKARA